MLYAAGVPDHNAMKNSPHVGVASVWWEGNPCKYARDDRRAEIIADGSQYAL